MWAPLSINFNIVNRHTMYQNIDQYYSRGVKYYIIQILSGRIHSGRRVE
jgi:hypothetical protein